MGGGPVVLGFANQAVVGVAFGVDDDVTHAGDVAALGSVCKIAQAVGGGWAVRAAAACEHFALAPPDVTASLSLMLLTDLRSVFASARIFTKPSVS